MTYKNMKQQSNMGKQLCLLKIYIIMEDNYKNLLQQSELEFYLLQRYLM